MLREFDCYLRGLIRKFGLGVLFFVGGVSLVLEAAELEVKSEYAPVYLGKTEMGYVPKGARLRSIREKDGHYLVEVIIDGSFRSMSWIKADEVEVVDKSVPEVQQGELKRKQLSHAYRKVKDAEKYKSSGALAKVSKALDEDDEAFLMNSRIVKVDASPPDPDSKWKHRVTTREFTSPDTETPVGASVRSVSEHPDDIDLSVAKAPEEKPENPIVSEKPLPYQEERTEQTLGKGTKSFEVSMGSYIALGVLFLFIVVGVIFAIKASNEQQKRNRKAMAPKLKAIE